MSLVTVGSVTTTMSNGDESSNKNAAIETRRQFDLKLARDAFVNCIQSQNVLLLREYIRAYEELCIFVSSLGNVFEWAIKDLTNKLWILKEHQRLDPTKYKTIQSMIAYEVESGRTKTRDTSILLPNGKRLPNGSRTLLRLHRALAFISSFLSQMRVAPDDASSASIAWNAYSATMAHFHTWPIRQTINVAIRLTLPTRRDLISKLISQRTPEEIDQFADEIVKSCDTIERTTQDLFEAYQIGKLS